MLIIDESAFVVVLKQLINTTRNVVHVNRTSNDYIQAKRNALVFKTFSKQSNESSQHNTLTNSL